MKFRFVIRDRRHIQWILTLDKRDIDELSIDQFLQADDRSGSRGNYIGARLGLGGPAKVNHFATWGEEAHFELALELDKPQIGLVFKDWTFTQEEHFRVPGQNL